MTKGITYVVKHQGGCYRFTSVKGADVTMNRIIKNIIGRTNRTLL